MSAVDAAAVTVEQRPARDVDAVGAQLSEAFTTMKDAVLGGRPVLVVVDDADLLGQGDPCDAAVAGSLLGMVRALALEGARKGWQLNVVTRNDGEAPDIGGALTAAGLTGQVVRAGSAHLGKVAP